MVGDLRLLLILVVFVADVFSVAKLAIGLLTGSVIVHTLAMRLAMTELALITITIRVDIRATSVHLVILIITLIHIWQQKYEK